MSHSLLRHDIAKYLTRAARNLGAATVSAALAQMLVRDLYEAPQGGRPSQRFDQLAEVLDHGVTSEVKALFDQLDRIEAGVRAHDQDALRAGAAIALRIAALIEAATHGSTQGSER